MTSHDSDPTRRALLGAAAGLATLTAVGCPPSDDSGTGTTPADSDPDTGTASVPDLGDPEISAELWQTMAAYGRASADGQLGTRIHLYNPAEVTQRVVLQVFSMAGVLVLHEVLSEAMAAGTSDHLDLGELLTRNDVPLPFEGSIWVGTTPASGITFMGLQGIVFDWFGPAHLASVHGMRDFGNSNHDTTWTDLILPKVVSTERYVTRVAVLNATGDGVAEALLATPEVIVRDDAGAELVSTTLEPLGPYCCTVFDVDELPGGDAIGTASLQVRELSAGLVVMAFLRDRDNDGFAAADHLFDRHFVTTSTGFVG